MDRKRSYVFLFQITQKFSPFWLPSVIHSVTWLWGLCAPSTLPQLLQLELDLPSASGAGFVPYRFPAILYVMTVSRLSTEVGEGRGSGGDGGEVEQ